MQCMHVRCVCMAALVFTAHVISLAQWRSVSWSRSQLLAKSGGIDVAVTVECTMAKSDVS
jgi:hypothetical protein